MKNVVDVQIPNIREMDKKELTQIEGGLIGLDDFLIGVAIGAAIAIIQDWDNFERGFTGKPYKS
jgi:lactobin A/cerein 7B family class IIb bacteriocin